MFCDSLWVHMRNVCQMYAYVPYMRKVQDTGSYSTSLQHRQTDPYNTIKIAAHQVSSWKNNHDDYRLQTDKMCLLSQRGSKKADNNCVWEQGLTEWRHIYT